MQPDPRETGEYVEYRLIPVHNATPPESGDTFTHETELGNTLTTKFTDTTTATYRELGEQQVTTGTLTVNGDISGDIQYRHESSLFVIAFTPPTPLEHYTIIEEATPFEMYPYTDVNNHWEFIKRADDINELLCQDYGDGGETIDLLAMDRENRNDKLNNKISEAHVTFNDIEVEMILPGELIVEVTTDDDPIKSQEPIISTYEDVMLGNMRADGLEVITDGEQKRIVRTTPSNIAVAKSKIQTLLSTPVFTD